MSDNTPIVNNSQFQSFYNEIYELINEDNAEYFMVKPTKSSAELDEMYNKYMSQSSDRKEKADAESLRQYGMTNRDHYYMLKSQLINGVEVEDDNPTYDPYDEEIDESTILESLIFNKKDLEINIDKFENGDKNVLLVTGLSGSGKSTLAKQLSSKYKCIHYELDVLDFYMNGKIKETDMVGNEDGLLAFINKKKLDPNTNLKNEEIRSLYREYIKFLIGWCKKQKDKKFIIEGLQIYEVYEDGDTFITSCPIIIKGTSALVSSIRGAKRNISDHTHKSFFKEFNGLIRWALKDSKSLDNLKKSISNESYIPISIFTNDLPMFTPLEFFEKIDENYSCFTEEESKDIKAWRESYALLGNGIKEPEYNKKNIKRMDILRKAIYQNNNEAILQCGWIPGVEFNSENRIKASQIVKEKMENKDYGIISYDKACIEEAKYSNSKKKAVSIVLCTGNSGFSKLIRTWQKTEFTHAAISLDDGIEKLYSFNVSGNGKFGGFSYESIEQGIKSGVKRIAIFTFLTTEEIYNNITKALNGFIDKAKDTSYSFLNVLAIAFNIPLELNNSMICSEFVDKLLKLGNVDLTNKTSSLVSPKDFAMVATTNGKIVKIFDNHPSKFKHSEMKRKIKNLKYSSLPIFEFVQYNTGGIITEAKSLPIQFDSDGNLLVNNIRQINFEQEYANSHRLLMEYDKTGNYEAMKYELAKMHFLITLLEKKIYKQGKDKSVKEIKVRARYLNDFKKYLKVVNANDRNFNFTEYFEQSPFNDAIIKIDKYTLKFGWEALKTMIK